MKSFNNLKSLFKLYLYSPINPISSIEDSDIENYSLIEHFGIVFLSSFLFILGIFISGDLIYNIFYEQYSTFLLEQLTSSSLFGFWISRYDFVLVFISEILFILKSWLYFSVLIYAFLKLFKQEISLKSILKIITWAIYPFAWILLLLSAIINIFTIFLPLYYHYIYYFGLASIFLIFVPVKLQIINETYPNTQLSSYKLYLSYFLTIFIAIIIWTFNHYDLITIPLV